MIMSGRALRLTVFLDDTDVWHHRPMFTEIVHRAHAAGLAGASVFRGVEGFGTTQIVHTTRLLSMADDLPVAVVIIDTEERIRAFLPPWKICSSKESRCWTRSRSSTTAAGNRTSSKAA